MIEEHLVDGELTVGRDFELYAKAMDVGLALKLSDIFPHLLPGRIIDKGCGTGALMAAIADRWPGSSLTGVDLSEKLLLTAKSKTYNTHVNFIQSNITQTQLPAEGADSIVYSSVMHEVFSYSGYQISAVEETLSSAFTELRPGGRVVIRDGVKPQEQTVLMSMEPVTYQRFLRFSTDFRPGSTNPGVRYEKHADINGLKTVELSMVAASEFLSKKDYLENWDCEVQEAFCYATPQNWEDLFAGAGFETVSLKTYSNLWIINNRYQNKAWLYALDGTLLNFPPTNIVAVAQKPL